MNLRPRRPQHSDINLTPLIDIVFLLLIFFMVSTTFKDDSRLKLELPEAAGDAVPAEEPKHLSLAIDRWGRYYVNDRLVVGKDVETLMKAMRGVLGTGSDLPLVISADAATPHQAVMSVLDAASRMGLTRVAFAATQPEADDEQGGSAP